MSTEDSPPATNPAECDAYSLKVGDPELNFAEHVSTDPVVTIDQILTFASVAAKDEYDVYQYRDDVTLARVGADEIVDLRKPGVESFIVVRTDRAYRLIVNDERYDWGARYVSGKLIRAIANIAPDQVLYLERKREADLELSDADTIDLEASGTEKIYSEKRTWKLKIRGEVFSFDTPCISAREALAAAGFNLAKGWDMILKTASGKRPVDIDDKIDLGEPGIEKLRVKPRIINNGEKRIDTRREFSILEADEAYLDRLGWKWETVLDCGKRWLLIHGYALPTGYNVSRVTMAIDVPGNYPASQIDMFYCFPRVTLASGIVVAQTEATQSIQGKPFQRWSRHRQGESEWDPASDRIETHLMVIDECLSREVEA